MTDKQKIKLEISLVDYAMGSGMSVKRVGRSWRVNPCPVCGNHDHFSIAQNLSGEWYYNSFSQCVKGGDIFTFVMEVEKAASNFKEALEYVKNRINYVDETEACVRGWEECQHKV